MSAARAPFLCAHSLDLNQRPNSLASVYNFAPRGCVLECKRESRSSFTFSLLRNAFLPRIALKHSEKRQFDAFVFKYICIYICSLSLASRSPRNSNDAFNLIVSPLCVMFSSESVSGLLFCSLSTSVFSFPSSFYSFSSFSVMVFKSVIEDTCYNFVQSFFFHLRFSVSKQVYDSFRSFFVSISVLRLSTGADNELSRTELSAIHFNVQLFGRKTEESFSRGIGTERFVALLPFFVFDDIFFFLRSFLLCCASSSDRKKVLIE